MNNSAKIEKTIVKILLTRNDLHDEQDLNIYWDGIFFTQFGFHVCYKMFKNDEWTGCNFADIMLSEVMFKTED